ncbi:helix-turn-helix transcriptional regulator [Parasulfitobacter algicola]|uniref:Helix-turn-helix transcriptional regulator n=1 Tax=Parasulfitobacter algicola TaxID=2614809 RepID=A0ABX2IRQ5_9RHOB|nr:helix-turn-helix transcriptional regulator [Sulfitobacter algicola]NSX55576.1 helix-turn-helix transcriptional regulator [Sulfitobacter algicola]
MTITPADYLTTKELADLLRIKERKIYDMASNGDVPCVRVVGKLLFPRAEIETWLGSARSGPYSAPQILPNTFAGSHDPLFEWALRESGSGLAAFFDGSHDGLDRCAAGDAMGCGLHIHESNGWNIKTVADHMADQPVILIEFARRQRGLLMAQGNPKAVTGLQDISTLRIAQRQPSAASHRLFEKLVSEAGFDISKLSMQPTPARTEQDVALAILEGKADTGFGLQAVAVQFKLDFLPVIEERFDLLIWRKSYFDPAFQTLFDFLKSDGFKKRAAEMTGYDITNLGTVHYNSACL